MRARTESDRLYQRASRTIAGGVNSPSRTFAAVGGGAPVLMAQSHGAYFWDVDRNPYIDYLAAYGALILGHAHPAVVKAAAQALSSGSVFGTPHPGEALLAEALAEAIPGLERLRFTCSGTEAVMTALRVARAFTGRDLILKFDGAYHGHSDPVLVAAGSGSSTLGIGNSAGLPAGVRRDVISLPYNDPEALSAAFAGRGDAVACVLVEPVVGNFGIVLPEPGFLAAIAAKARQAGALVIWDEVITAFRFAYGSIGRILDGQPDLYTLGKLIGGGLPIGAYGGRADVMALVAPLGPVYQDGTLAGNPVSMAAGLATLAALREHGLYERLDRLGARLAAGLEEAAARHGLEVRVNRLGGALSLHFSGDPVRDFAGAVAASGEQFARFFHAMLDQGICLAPSKYEAWFVSAAHTDVEIDYTLEAAERAFAAVAGAPFGPLPGPPAPRRPVDRR